GSGQPPPARDGRCGRRDGLRRFGRTVPSGDWAMAGAAARRAAAGAGRRGHSQGGCLDRALSARDGAVPRSRTGTRAGDLSVLQSHSPRGSRPRRGAARAPRTLVKARFNKGSGVAAVSPSCQHAGMDQAVDLRVLEMLAARLCHDLIGPVAGIGNGVELLADEEPDFVQDAIALVGESARKANRRLQFYRFAYGFSGGELAGLPPHRLASALFEESSVACDYRQKVRGLPLEWQKLACNML